MTVLSAFEERKETLRQRLAAAGTPEESSKALQAAFSAMAEALAAEEENDTARQRSRAVLALAKEAPALLLAGTAKGELVLPEKGAAKMGSRLPFGALAAGGVLLAVLAAYELISGRIVPALLIVIGGLLLAGVKLMDHGDQWSARGQAYCDADRLIEESAKLCRAVDGCLADLAIIDQENRLRLGAVSDDALLSMIGVLLEAKASGRADMAVRSLDEAQQYLRQMGMEPVDYSADQSAYFDLLPTLGEPRTLRPALLKEGKLLRRGVAAVSEKGADA